jgi:hypothetical protein
MTELKQTRLINKWLFWILLLTIGVVLTSSFEYNNIKMKQQKIENSVAFRFKSYDFEYFFKHHRVIPNPSQTSGSICIDTSKKETFYIGSRIQTHFYKHMNDLSCDLLDNNNLPNVHFGENHE